MPPFNSRFKDNPKPLGQADQAYQFVPFGAGHRACPGYRQAFSQVATFVAVIALQTHEFSLVGPRPDWKYAPVPPADGLIVQCS
mmetsp:Transcript_39163/g.98724  ORF Transcript_39163/g.98724 Transcript_39163/m.98724 type:complete len:84 (-) Transcript_39163:11-262(-)